LSKIHKKNLQLYTPSTFAEIAQLTGAVWGNPKTPKILVEFWNASLSKIHKMLQFYTASTFAEIL
jgi:hypothetical protein